MAVIQYTGIVNDIRGKLNGSVFNKSRTISTLQRKQQQPRGSRGFQSEIRNIFSSAQRIWKTISSTNQERWATTAANNPSRNRFGDLVALSGYNQYIKASILASYGNTVLPSTPYQLPAPSNSLGATEVGQLAYLVSTSTPNLMEYNISMDVLVTDGEFAYIFDVAPVVSTGVTTYHGRFSHVVGKVITDNSTVTGSVNLGSKYPIPQSTTNIYVRHRLVHIASGAVVQEIVTTASLEIIS